MLLYTPEADAVRAVFRDVFGWAHVEDHPGWLIFALPPSELGIHPSQGSTKHEICLMCDDLESTMAELREQGIEFRGEPRDEGFRRRHDDAAAGWSRGAALREQAPNAARSLEEARRIEQPKLRRRGV